VNRTWPWCGIGGDEPPEKGTTVVDLTNLTQAIEDGDRATAMRLTEMATGEGTQAATILNAMTTAMEEVGRRFESNEIFIPEMLLSARAMSDSMALLTPLLVAADVRPEFTAVIGTVQGDLHNIGKNLVATMWKGANIEVVDLGTNVAPETFVEAVRRHRARVLGISALLTTTMMGMRGVVDAIRNSDVAEVKIVIGGAPVTEAFAKQIGADGYAPDAPGAVRLARVLVDAGSNPTKT
jgi:5-methyltetrahydrofolate--homocysteine methyltransferase